VTPKQFTRPQDGGRAQPALVIFLWLAFSAFPIVDLLASGPPPWRAVLLLALGLAFVGTYLYAMLSDRRMPGTQGWQVVAPLAVLSVALLAIDGPRWTPMAVFTAAAAGRRLPSDHAGRAIAALAAVAAGGILLDGGSAGDALVIALTTLGIGFWALSFVRTLVQNEELRAAQAEIARLAVADERLRFARDLHDLLGHSLSVVALKSELAGRLLPDRPEDAAQHVADIQAVSRRALAEVREAVSGYRRPVLAEELEGARAALAGAGVEVDVQAPRVELPADAEAVLAWAVREGATNALRHAGARHVRIAVQADGERARVEVLDDGGGAGAGTAVNGDAGTGLAGLAERAARVRGRMDAGPARGGGFRLAVDVPLEVAP
jgi:two-component system, NarL family, sensor histidine kinase DesK